MCKGRVNRATYVSVDEELHLAQSLRSVQRHPLPLRQPPPRRLQHVQGARIVEAQLEALLLQRALEHDLKGGGVACEQVIRPVLQGGTQELPGGNPLV